MHKMIFSLKFLKKKNVIALQTGDFNLNMHLYSLHLLYCVYLPQTGS